MYVDTSCSVLPASYTVAVYVIVTSWQVGCIFDAPLMHPTCHDVTDLFVEAELFGLEVLVSMAT